MANVMMLIISSDGRCSMVSGWKERGGDDVQGGC